MDRQALLNLLSLTCSEDAEQRRTAERALLLGDRRGGADFRIDRQLLTLAFDKSLSLGMRLAAAIRLKQNLQTRTEREGIPSEDEEGELRQIQACLLQQLQPLPASLKKQLALCITTLALKRWPQQWPDLLPALATNITQKGASTEVCLYVLQKLLKTLRPIQFYSSSSGFNSSGLSKPGPLRVDVEEKRTGKGGKILPRTSPEQRRALLAYVQQSLLALCFNQWKLCTGVLLRALSQEASSDSKGGGLSAKHAAEQGALGLLQLRLTKCTVHCVLLTLPTLQEASAPLRMVLHDMAQSLRSLAQVQARLSPEHVVAGSLTRCTLRTARLFKLTIKEFPQLLVGSVQKLGALFLEILNHSFQPGHLRFCFEALTVQALLFFLDLCQLRFEAITEGLPLDSFSSSNEPSSPGLDSARQLSPRAQLVVELRTFLTAALVLDLIQLLVTQFFVLTAADLQAWQSDPEGLVFSEARLALDEKARPGAELLFWQLLNMSERETVIGYLLRLFQKHVGDCPPGNPPATAAPLCSLQQAIAQHGRAWPTPTIPRAILAKDALYSAVGLGSMQLAAAISAISKDGSPPTTREAGHMSSDSSAGPAALSFSNWYKQVLHQELRDLTPGREVLRRRAVWVLGEWADQITDELRPSVYTNVAGLIQDPDQVVQLTAALALKQIIFPHDFMSSFHLVEPHLNALTLGLCDLTIKVKSLQTRDSLLQVLQSLVRTCGPRIAAVLGVFVQRFPHLWTACEQKNEALDLLGAMLRALSSHAIPLYPFLRTVLHFCLQPSTQPERTYLIPLALELYQTTLQHCPLQLPSLTFSSTAASSIFTAGANAPRKRSGGKGGSMSTGGCIVPGCGAPVFKKFHCAEHLSASRGQAYSPASPHTSPQNEHGGIAHPMVEPYFSCLAHYIGHGDLAGGATASPATSGRMTRKKLQFSPDEGQSGIGDRSGGPGRAGEVGVACENWVRLEQLLPLLQSCLLLESRERARQRVTNILPMFLARTLRLFSLMDTSEAGFLAASSTASSYSINSAAAHLRTRTHCLNELFALYSYLCFLLRLFPDLHPTSPCIQPLLSWLLRRALVLRARKLRAVRSGSGGTGRAGRPRMSMMPAGMVPGHSTDGARTDEALDPLGELRYLHRFVARLFALHPGQTLDALAPLLHAHLKDRPQDTTLQAGPETDPNGLFFQMFPAEWLDIRYYHGRDQAFRRVCVLAAAQTMRGRVEAGLPAVLAGLARHAAVRPMLPALVQAVTWLEEDRSDGDTTKGTQEEQRLCALNRQDVLSFLSVVNFAMRVSTAASQAMQLPLDGEALEEIRGKLQAASATQ